MWNLKNKVKKKREQTHGYREQTGSYQMRGIWGAWVKHMKGLSSTNQGDEWYWENTLKINYLKNSFTEKLFVK